MILKKRKMSIEHKILNCIINVRAMSQVTGSLTPDPPCKTVPRPEGCKCKMLFSCLTTRGENRTASVFIFQLIGKQKEMCWWKGAVTLCTFHVWHQLFIPQTFSASWLNEEVFKVWKMTHGSNFTILFVPLNYCLQADVTWREGSTPSAVTHFCIFYITFQIFHKYIELISKYLTCILQSV